MTRKLTIALAAILLLNGCFYRFRADEEEPKPNKEQKSNDKTIDQQVDAFVKSGKIPALDRSSSILGPDGNQNGIRDDIEAQIAKMPINDRQKTLTMNYARSVQAILAENVMTEKALRDVSSAYMLAELCLFNAFAKPDKNLQRSVVNRVRSYTINTKERSRQFTRFDRMMNGKVFSLPSRAKCQQFDFEGDN